MLPDALLEKLEGRFHWEVMGRADDAHTVIRLVTSWATRPEAVQAFVAALD